MVKTIFDAVDEELPEGQEGYLALAARVPSPKNQGFLHEAGEYGRAALKGLVQGAHALGEFADPFQKGKPLGMLVKKSPLLPPREKLEEELEEILPTEPTFGKELVRKGAKEIPAFGLLGGGSVAGKALRPLASGALQESAKALGAPEALQQVAALPAYFAPNFAQKLIEKGKYKDLIKEGRKLGLTDEELTPLIQSSFKEKHLTKLVPRRGKTQKALTSTKEALDKAYGGIAKSSEAQQQISPEALGDFLQEMGKKGLEVPERIRSLFSKDLKDLMNSKFTGEDLINFYADLNDALGPSSKQVALFKPIVKKAIQSIDPQLSKDFEAINNLYSKYYPIAARLKPTVASDIFGHLENFGAVAAMVTGHYPFITKIAGEKALRKIAQEMTLNPRLQQLSKKMVVALNHNKLPLAEKVANEFFEMALKDDPEEADRLKKLTIEELKDFFSTNQKHTTTPSPRK